MYSNNILTYNYHDIDICICSQKMLKALTNMGFHSTIAKMHLNISRNNFLQAHKSLMDLCYESSRLQSEATAWNPPISVRVGMLH
jgi:hypothetical protein